MRTSFYILFLVFFLLFFPSCISTRTYEERIAEYEEKIFDLESEVEVLKKTYAQIMKDSSDIRTSKTLIMFKLGEIRKSLETMESDSSVIKIQEDISVVEALCARWKSNN